MVGTTSRSEVLESMDLAQAFNVNLNVPALKQDEIKQVSQRNGHPSQRTCAEL